MKNNIKKYCYFFLMFAFLMGSNNQAFGQMKEDINYTAGFGFPELSNIGVRFQMNQVQIGFSIGTLFFYDDPMFSYSSDVYYHFGGHSDFSDRRPWYARVGVNYIYDQEETGLHEYVFFNPRIGREFNLSSKVGVEISAGALFEISHKVSRQRSSDLWYKFVSVKETFDLDFKNSIIPSAGIGVFYRFGE